MENANYILILTLCLYPAKASTICTVRDDNPSLYDQPSTPTDTSPVHNNTKHLALHSTLREPCPSSRDKDMGEASSMPVVDTLHQTTTALHLQTTGLLLSKITAPLHNSNTRASYPTPSNILPR